MDPLSDILSLLKPRAYVTGGISAGGEWSVRFPPHNVIKCYSVIKGDCWLLLEGVADPVRLLAGSCLLLPRGWPFVLASDLALPPRDGLELLTKRERYNGILTITPGEDLFILGSHFELEGDARFLRDVLPPVVILDEQLQKETLRWAVERLLREMRDPQPGGILIAQQIAYTLVVEALRLHLADDAQRGTGWLAALADARMAAALSSIHEEPARPWSLQQLAHSAGMSRTAFAQTFKRAVGQSPMEYLLDWRMTLAANKLKQAGATIAKIAPQLGYQSESAFSTAFKRHWGSSPRDFARRSRGPAVMSR